MTSADVLHSFWVPTLAGKRDLVPGRTTRIKITPLPEAAGSELPGQCAEFCGLSHADMRIAAFVESEASFATWTAGQLAAAQVPAAGPAAAGYETFTQTCTTCHVARVQNTDGSLETIGTAFGPDLTHFGSRTTIGAGILSNDDAHLAEWIDDPSAVKPMAPELNDLAEGRVLGMPDYGLDPERIAELVALLEGWT
jgi:cytochrome c oxidase subunit 2